MEKTKLDHETYNFTNKQEDYQSLGVTWKREYKTFIDLPGTDFISEKLTKVASLPPLTIVIHLIAGRDCIESRKRNEITYAISLKEP